jgi:hypothetical protein
MINLPPGETDMMLLPMVFGIPEKSSVTLDVKGENFNIFPPIFEVGSSGDF